MEDFIGHVPEGGTAEHRPRGRAGHEPQRAGEAATRPAPKVSIIMPVYNSARFMGRGIEKILSQSVGDLELICVDDCSSDDSQALIRSYMGKDARVRGIFRTENGGSASARNSGLEAARGEYVAFVDSDDYPADGSFYEKLLETSRSNDADIVKGSHVIEGRPQRVDPQNTLIRSNKHNFVYNFWSAIFRRSVLDEHGIRFPGVRNMEDPPFALHAAIHANTVAIRDDAILTIVQRAASKTNRTPEVSRIKDLFTSLGIIVDLMNGHVNFPKVCYIRNFVFLTTEILKYCNRPDAPVAEDIIQNGLTSIKPNLAYQGLIWPILRHFRFFPNSLR